MTNNKKIDQFCITFLFIQNATLNDVINNQNKTKQEKNKDLT